MMCPPCDTPQPSGAFLVLLIVATVLAGRNHAFAQAPAADPWSACAAAATIAEKDAGVPAGLLLAIGKVESGRAEPNTGRATPWPFAINVAGEGRYNADVTDAIGAVRAAQAGGVQSIDVGCFQISLLHHPNAFGSLTEAFDPARNAAYAAHFLASLRETTGSWVTAVGHYHSAVPERGEPYANRVLAIWSGDASTLPSGRGIVPARAMAAGRSGVQVYGPGMVYVTRPPGRTVLPIVYIPTVR